MKKAVYQTVSVSLFIVLLIFTAAIMPSIASAYEPVVHSHIAREAEFLYRLEVGKFPALSWNLDIIAAGAEHEDAIDHIWGHGGDYVTCSHFWDPDIADLSENNYFAGTPCGNAYMKSNELLDRTFESLSAQDYYQWFEYFGHITHLIGDMTVPAHTHIDIHAFDSYEKCWCPTYYAGYIAPLVEGGPVDVPEGYIQYILADEADTGAYGLGYDSRMYAKLYYLMFMAAQTGDYFPSDDYDGNDYDKYGGWMNYTDFPDRPRTWADLDDNWWYDSDDSSYHCSNSDNDFTKIGSTSIPYAIRSVASLYLAFRDAFDGVPAVSEANLTYSTEPPYSDWTNDSVTVTLSADDDPSTRYVSGVYEINFGNGSNYTEPILVSEEGIHEINYWSMDWFGNEEPKKIVTVKIDKTPPVITFPDLKLNYLTSEEFIATWDATDALSGINHVDAFIDGQGVIKGQVSLPAGTHRLEVYAYDEAGNSQYGHYDFEVWIDADAWCFSVLINNKTKGSAMSCVIEFPAPYDIGMVDMTTATLAVKGTLELEDIDPIVGETALLPATLLTGIGDHDLDGIPDRSLQFNKEMFVAALAGQIGNIKSLISGGLLPSGQPRFIAEATASVFKSTKK